MRRVISVLGVAALVLAGSVAHAEVTPPPPQQQGCDFMTGGGWIIHSGAKGTFGVGGGCKHGSGVTTPEYWGHLEYHRSEEHTSELQSRLHLVCRLLLE